MRQSREFKSTLLCEVIIKLFFPKWCQYAIEIKSVSIETYLQIQFKTVVILLKSQCTQQQ